MITNLYVNHFICCRVLNTYSLHFDNISDKVMLAQLMALTPC